MAKDLGFEPVLGSGEGVDNLPHEAVMFRYNVGQGGMKRGVA